jgi:hypothetical protein
MKITIEVPHCETMSSLGVTATLKQVAQAIVISSHSPRAEAAPEGFVDIADKGKVLWRISHKKLGQLQPTQFKPMDTVPSGEQTKVLLKTMSNIILLGLIFEDGSVGVYAYPADRYYVRDARFFKGWMPLPQ